MARTKLVTWFFKRVHCSDIKPQGNQRKIKSHGPILIDCYLLQVVGLDELACCEPSCPSWWGKPVSRTHTATYAAAHCAARSCDQHIHPLNTKNAIKLWRRIFLTRIRIEVKWFAKHRRLPITYTRIYFFKWTNVELLFILAFQC
jgi:hypothetical protein